MKKQAKKSAKRKVSSKVGNNHINRLEIKNFKSIKQMNIEPKRINIFIGRPNVGKSNVLEAISLLGGYYSSQINEGEKFLSDFIRYRDLSELYFERLTDAPVEVITDKAFATLRTRPFSQSNHCYIVANGPEVLSYLNFNEDQRAIRDRFGEYVTENFKNDGSNTPTPACQFISNSGKIDLQDVVLQADNPYKKYEYKRQDSFPNRYHKFLLPPYGPNLYTLIKQNRTLYQSVAKIFKQYKLDFVLLDEQPVLALQKKSRGIVTTYAYSGIADTLQRYIFHLAAIESNKNSVLIFEEPEAHNFPAYIRQLAEDIIADGNGNQYFISTHSPFILNIILENARKDVAVFKLEYKNYQTVAEPLSEKEISDYLSYGTDIFFQLLK